MHSHELMSAEQAWTLRLTMYLVSSTPMQARVTQDAEKGLTGLLRCWPPTGLPPAHPLTTLRHSESATRPKHIVGHIEN